MGLSLPQGPRAPGANHPEMRRILGALVTIVVLAGVAAPARADIDHTVCARMGSAPKGTTFEVQGSGADAIVGGWRTQEDSADLCFRGLAGANGKTSITGQWTSRWNPIDSGGFSGVPTDNGEPDRRRDIHNRGAGALHGGVMGAVVLGHGHSGTDRVPGAGSRSR